jgi:polar amino acid transport system substrate-binding protein
MKRAAIAVATGLLATSVLAGCGSSPAAPSGEPAAESAAASQGDSLRAKLPQEIQSSGVLVVAGDNHPPYRSIGPDGKTVTGIDTDVWEALEAELGVEVRMEVASSMPSILTGMQANRWAAYNGPVRATAEREELFDSVTWMKTRTSYVFPASKSGSFSDPSDLCGTTIAIVTGSVVGGDMDNLNKWCAEHNEPNAQKLELADTNATVLAVQAERADALGLTETGALDILRANEGKFAYISQSSEYGAEESLLALLTPKDSGIGPVLLEAFERIFENGKYEEIMREWGLEAVTVEKPQINAISGRVPA